MTTRTCASSGAPSSLWSSLVWHSGLPFRRRALIRPNSEDTDSRSLCVFGVQTIAQAWCMLWWFSGRFSHVDRRRVRVANVHSAQSMRVCLGAVIIAFNLFTGVTRYGCAEGSMYDPRPLTDRGSTTSINVPGKYSRRGWIYSS